MSHRIVQVNAFTDRPFSGNPAAVMVLDQPAEADWMQNVAREMNLSETSFLHRESDAYRLRWFTPTVEVDLCGHATLAASHVLWEDGHLPADAPAVFETRSGRLTARRDGPLIALDFPADPVAERPEPPGLTETLGLSKPARFVGGNRRDLFVVLDSEQAVRSLSPDFRRLTEIPVRGVIATATSESPGFDFVSRFFAPRLGIDEDPVCGSAHCALAPYWCDRLGSEVLLGHQISARGGTVRVRFQGIGRVELAGQAVTVWRGNFIA